MSEHMSPIPSRVYNAAVGGHVCGPEDVDFGQKVVHLIKYDRAGNEVSFESQVTQANKIYVIHDDFVLSSNVTIPANCVLKFEGGSISGAYTLTGANTGIVAGLIKIFNTNIIIGGTWKVDEVYPEWFGIYPDNQGLSLGDAMVNLNAFNSRVYFSKGTYYTNTPVKLINACGTGWDSAIAMLKNGNNLYTAYIGDIEAPASSSVREHCCIRDLKIWIDTPDEEESSYINSSCALLVGCLGQSVIENCYISTYWANHKATANVTEAQRIQAASENNKEIEYLMNAAVKFITYTEALAFVKCQFGGMVGCFGTSDAILDYNSFYHCGFDGSPRGYAAFLFDCSVSSLSFTGELSLNRVMYGIKAYNNFNGVSLVGGRLEQCIVLEDDNDDILGAFIYVNGTDVVNIGVSNYYINPSINGLYLKGTKIQARFVNCFLRGVDDPYNAHKYTLIAHPTNSNTAQWSSIITENCELCNGRVELTSLVLKESKSSNQNGYSSKNRAINNCLIVSSNYYATSQYKGFSNNHTKLIGGVISETSASYKTLDFWLTARLDFNTPAARFKGPVHIYNNSHEYQKTVYIDIIICNTGEITKIVFDDSIFTVSYNSDNGLTQIGYSAGIVEFAGDVELLKTKTAIGSFM